MRRKIKEEHIKKAKEIHGNKYSYDLVVYVNYDTKVKIICPEHGIFEQCLYEHKKGQGCKKCVIESISSNTKEFIEKSRKIHGNKYDYSDVNYVNNTIRVKIFCKKHNEFFNQTPAIHLSGKGCPKCGKKNQIKKLSFSQDEFIEKSIKIHGNKYNYSEVNYKNTYTKIKIICNECNNIFEQRPDSHLRCYINCPECVIKNLISNTKEFIEKSIKVHGDKYDYSDVNYICARTEVKIKCNKCNTIFEQNPNGHLGGSGCPYCKQSKGEIKIKNILNELGIEYEIQMRFDNCRNKNSLPFDFYIPDQNLLVEYNGIQHFEPVEFFGGEKIFKLQVKLDQIKVDYCKNNNIPLHIIKYDENIEGRMKEILQIS